MKTNFEQFLDNLDLEAFASGLPVTKDINSLDEELNLSIYKIGQEDDLSVTYAFGENLNLMYRFFRDETMNIIDYEQIEVSIV